MVVHEISPFRDEEQGILQLKDIRSHERRVLSNAVRTVVSRVDPTRTVDVYLPVAQNKVGGQTQALQEARQRILQHEACTLNNQDAVSFAH